MHVRVAAAVLESFLNNMDNERKSYLTEKVTWKKVSGCINRMFERDKRRRARNVYPSEPCVQCGSKAWESEIDGIWRCFICGHRGFWENGVFTQSKPASEAEA